MFKNKKIAIISAFCRENRIIGNSGKIPWQRMIPSDMKRFVELTKGQTVVMGRKTWDSIPEKFRPFDKNLPLEESRQTIVITRNNLSIENERVLVVHSIEEALNLARSEKVWIAGGAEIYTQTFYLADELYLTVVDGNFDGDAFFPIFSHKNWETVLYLLLKPESPGAEKDKLGTEYFILKRKD